MAPHPGAGCSQGQPRWPSAPPTLQERLLCAHAQSCVSGGSANRSSSSSRQGAGVCRPCARFITPPQPAPAPGDHRLHTQRRAPPCPGPRVPTAGEASSAPLHRGLLAEAAPQSPPTMSQVGLGRAGVLDPGCPREAQPTASLVLPNSLPLILKLRNWRC